MNKLFQRYIFALHKSFCGRSIFSPTRHPQMFIAFLASFPSYPPFQSVRSFSLVPLSLPCPPLLHRLYSYPSLSLLLFLPLIMNHAAPPLFWAAATVGGNVLWFLTGELWVYISTFLCFSCFCSFLLFPSILSFTNFPAISTLSLLPSLH